MSAKDLRQNCRCSQLLQKRAFSAPFPAFWLQFPGPMEPIAGTWTCSLFVPARRDSSVTHLRLQSWSGRRLVLPQPAGAPKLAHCSTGSSRSLYLSLRQGHRSGHIWDNEFCESDGGCGRPKPEGKAGDAMGGVLRGPAARRLTSQPQCSSVLPRTQSQGPRTPN